MRHLNTPLYLFFRFLRILENSPISVPFDSITFTRWIHSVGINCQMTGRLLNSTRHVWVRELVMSEIVGRTLKHILFGCIRTVVFLDSSADFETEKGRELIARVLPVPKVIGSKFKSFFISIDFLSLLIS